MKNEQTTQEKHIDIAGSQLNDQKNVQNAGIRYSQENLQGGNGVTGLNDYQLHKPILSSH